MGYSKSPKAILRVQEYLNLMVAAPKGKEIIFAAPNPNKLSYQLREAIAAAAENQDRFAVYAELKTSYIIRIKSSSVVAEPRLGFEDIPTMGKTQIVEECDEAAHIIGPIVMREHPQEIHYPNAKLPEEELIAVYRAIEAIKKTKNIQYYIIDHQGAGITLTQQDPGNLKWEPPST